MFGHLRTWRDRVHYVKLGLETEEATLCKVEQMFWYSAIDNFNTLCYTGGRQLNRRVDMDMKLRQTLDQPVHGYWDGGAKQVFDWGIEGSPATDGDGQYVKIGSWTANHWFHVALGRTVKLTLSYAMRHLKAVTRIPSTFEYIEVD